MFYRALMFKKKLKKKIFLFYFKNVSTLNFCRQKDSCNFYPENIMKNDLMIELENY